MDFESILHRKGTKAYCHGGHHVATVKKDIVAGVEVRNVRDIFEFTENYLSNGKEDGGKNGGEIYLTLCVCGKEWFRLFFRETTYCDEVVRIWDQIDGQITEVPYSEIPNNPDIVFYKRG